MNYITLTSEYRLYAFPDYKSMQEAKALMRNVVIAKELTKVREIEAKTYVRRVSETGYKNYLRDDTGDLKANGKASLVTALQALYKLNGYSARYIIVERLY